MSFPRFSLQPPRILRQVLTPSILLLLLTFPALPDFWSMVNKSQPETIKLSRKLPPVSARNGNTVKFAPEIAGNSIPPETATILKEKIRTLLLHAKAGGIQLVDDSADTVIKCIVTSYEPKSMHAGQRKVGVKDQQIQTWIGNIGASVQVLDNRNRPIDAANVKNHLENDFVIAEREESVAAVNDKKTSWRDRVAGGLKVARGGEAGDVAKLAGGGQQMHDALDTQAKGARPPTDTEWRDALIEGLAAKVANRIVPIDQEFVAVLPLNKEFKQIRELAKSNRWGDVQEQTEKMSPLSGSDEAYRLYLIGLSYEALAYEQADKPNEAAETLNKASKYYADAKKVKSSEREILLAQIRVQDSLDHYLEIEHYLQSRSQSAPADQAVISKAPGGSPEPASNENLADNSALIEMTKAGMPESVLITFVQTTADPKFDVSANGLLQLARGKVTPHVIETVQKKMTASPTTQDASRQAPPRTKQPPSPKPVK